ncbi:methyl-accepting chemotaxis protein [Rhodobacter sp. JA431]|uniref:methyl-accepting chemotaxis protein n=1 Tax=Rhodobacter sp. JA431 TaxID=570013 RepID=UPI000BD8D3BF|nr:methyl-accepting chemotaxis protein [Rhodobacter sp. JA431]SOC13937.1 methyl-accepting chemotaxis protein [Rhodobacter sp. JA431]
MTQSLNPRTDDAQTAARINRIAADAVLLGRDVAEVAGALDALEQHIDAQMSLLQTARSAAETVQDANTRVLDGADRVSRSADVTLDLVEGTVAQLRETGAHAQTIAAWVRAAIARMEEINTTLIKVQSENAEIKSVAKQVNILAINAKIEAARAGDSGKGFAVVAEAINELSRKTAAAADGIGTAVGGLSSSVGALHDEAGAISQDANAVLTGAAGTDTALGRMVEGLKQTREAVSEITARAGEVNAANGRFAPAFRDMADGMTSTSAEVHQAAQKTQALILAGETIVQEAVELGGATTDDAFIRAAQGAAAEIGQIFESAIQRGQIAASSLFDSRYTAIPGTDPAQVMAPFTSFTDSVLPEVQERMLSLSQDVVFCAAVDRNGYLPTHNLKFSQPQSVDPVWNAANCRNRRIFNDRVGLRAGQSTAPFLLQIYRRDMGGGEFVLMKDLSAPIFVNGKHWGGLRLAYRM